MINYCKYIGWDNQGRKYKLFIWPEKTTEKQYTDWIEKNGIDPWSVICTDLVFKDWGEDPYDENGRFFITAFIGHEYCLSAKNRKSKVIFWQWNSKNGFSYYSEKRKPLKTIPRVVKDEIKEVLKNMMKHFYVKGFTL